MTNIIIQALGFAGLFFYILSFQIKSNRALFLMQLIGNVFFGIQFYCLGSVSGGVSVFVFILRNLLMLKHKEWGWVRSKWTLAAFCAAYAAIAVVFWDGLPCILVLIAAVVGSVGFWTNNAQKIRLSVLVAVSPCWLIYDIMLGSIGGIINELFCLISLLISIKRFGWKNMATDKDFEK